MSTIDESKRRNYFTFATQELAQDAFLRWFLENWDHPQMVGLVKRFLIEVAKMPIEEREIKCIKTEAQWNKIDIRAEVQFKTGKPLWLFIEDKVQSILGMEKKKGELTGQIQLVAYNKEIDKEIAREGRNLDSVYHVYFKTGFANKWEKAKVEETVPWFFVGRKDIVDFFAEFTTGDYPSPLLDFANRLLAIGEVPAERMDQWTIENWLAWINIELMPTIQRKFKTDVFVETFSFRGGYAGIFVCKERVDKPNSYICLEVKFPSEETDGDSQNLVSAILRPLNNLADIFETQSPWQGTDVETLRTRLRRSSSLFTTQSIHGKSSFGKSKTGIPKSVSNEKMLEGVLEMIDAFNEFAKSLRFERSNASHRV